MEFQEILKEYSSEKDEKLQIRLYKKALTKLFKQKNIYILGSSDTTIKDINSNNFKPLIEYIGDKYSEQCIRIFSEKSLAHSYAIANNCTHKNEPLLIQIKPIYFMKILKILFVFGVFNVIIDDGATSVTDATDNILYYFEIINKERNFYSAKHSKLIHILNNVWRYRDEPYIAERKVGFFERLKSKRPKLTEIENKIFETKELALKYCEDNNINPKEYSFRALEKTGFFNHISEITTRDRVETLSFVSETETLNFAAKIVLNLMNEVVLSLEDSKRMKSIVNEIVEN